MSDDEDYTRGRHRGHVYPVPDLTDEAQFWGLGPRAGDEIPNFRAGRPWGKTFELDPHGTFSVTAIATEIFTRPRPFAFKLRFSLNAGGPFAAQVPITYGGTITVNVIESIDLKSGTIVESFKLVAGQNQTVCIALARSLSVTVSIPQDPSGEAPAPLFVQAVAALVETVTCEELTGAPSYSSAFVTRVPASATIVELLGFNPARKQFIVHNSSPGGANLAIKFGDGASLTAGAESYSVLLAPGARYESPIGGWGGEVTGIWSAADANGEALVTEGF
jgi:hypothetical protein